MTDIHVLGISAYFHDSAAALIRNGEVIAAASEERFSREKGDARFPARAAAYCLAEGGIQVSQLDAIGFYEKPVLKFDRILSTYIGLAPRGYQQFRLAGPLWIKDKLWVERNIREYFKSYKGRIYFSEHHESHAASAFFPSPFQEAAILTMDAVGEWATASIAIGRGADLAIIKEMRWPDSLGLLYSAFTYFLGFEVNSGEYKVMGLAPYGEPKYVDLIYENLVDLKEDGSFRLNQEYFAYLDSLTMTNDRFARLFGQPVREGESELTQRDMDIARSIQFVCEDIMLRMASTAHAETGVDSLCLAGGVALNCVGNGRILREGRFKNLWIQPAAGDAGGALGVAQLIWHREFSGGRRLNPGRESMKGSYLGPAFGDQELETYFTRVGARFHRFDREESLRRTAQLLADQKVVGWFSGRMEFGPRALGARSILADPRDPKMQSELNLKVKFRESFRPFAPSVLADRASDYFELDAPSPYMLLVAPVKQSRRTPQLERDELRGIDMLRSARSEIPAVTHVDYSARIQTVTRESNPDFYDLLVQFNQITGCPLLVNTSFNVRDEPIVCSPKDAYDCFMRTDIDVLVAGSFILHKSEQENWVETEAWLWNYPQLG